MSPVHPASRTGTQPPRSRSAQALAGLGLTLAASLALAAPTVPCPNGPDPLRFRPEASVAPVSSATDPLAIAATVDPATGREWIALAYLTPSGEVAVTVSGNGGCTFGPAGGGLAPTIVSGSGITARPAVALRVEAGAPLLAVAWRDVDRIVARATSSLDGIFSAEATLETAARSAPRLALAPAPASATLASAWLADAAGARVVRAAVSSSPLDPAAWPAASTLNGSLGADLGVSSEIALASDAAGSAGAPGFTLLATVTTTGAAHVARAEDGATFGPWRRVDDGSLARPFAPELSGGAGIRAWTAAAWSGRARTGPAVDRVAADAALEDTGALAFDFDGASAQPNSVQQSPVPSLTRVAVASAGSDPAGTAFILWEDSAAGDIQAARRPMASSRPQLAGGCGAFRVTGLDPTRSSGRASAPVASRLGDDVALAFVDTRDGAPAAFFKRSDSAAPAPTGLAAVAAGCGPPPRIQLSWDPLTCDVATLVVEVGLAPGATDSTRLAPLGTGYLVEGLSPGTAYFLRVRATDVAGNSGVSAEVTATTSSCSSALLRSSVVSVADTCAFGGAGGDGRVDPGESARLRVRVENIGPAAAAGVTLRGQSRSSDVTARSGTLNLGDLAPGASAESDLDFDLSATAACGARHDVLLRCDSAGAAWGDLATLPSGPPCTTCRNAACAAVADASRTAPRVICAGGTVTLDASASTSSSCGGTLVYQWWEGTTLLSTNSTVNRQPSASTAYRLVASCSTDFACAAETTVAITVNPLPGLTLTEEPPPPHCAGDTVTIRASSPDPTATFAWQDGQSGPTHDIAASGTLQCTATDANGCTRSRTIRVDFGEIPVADAGPDVAGCGGVLIGTPGFPLLDYRWDPPDGLSSRWVAQPRATPASATTYTLTVTDPATGCSSTDTVTADVTPGPGPLQDLRVARSGGELVFTWTDPPASLATRVYSDSDARAAATANATSATARLECQGSATCREAIPGEPLLFFQAVSVCLDGVNEGPN